MLSIGVETGTETGSGGDGSDEEPLFGEPMVDEPGPSGFPNNLVWLREAGFAAASPGEQVAKSFCPLEVQFLILHDLSFRRPVLP